MQALGDQAGEVFLVPAQHIDVQVMLPGYQGQIIHFGELNDMLDRLFDQCGGPDGGPDIGRGVKTNPAGVRAYLKTNEASPQTAWRRGIVETKWLICYSRS